MLYHLLDRHDSILPGDDVVRHGHFKEPFCDFLAFVPVVIISGIATLVAAFFPLDIFKCQPGTVAIAALVHLVRMRNGSVALVVGLLLSGGGNTSSRCLGRCALSLDCGGVFGEGSMWCNGRREGTYQVEA